MNDFFYLIINSEWALNDDSNLKHIKKHDAFPIGNQLSFIEEGCELLIKFKNSEGSLKIDGSGKIASIKDTFYIKSRILSKWVLEDTIDKHFVSIYVEGTPNEARLIVQLWNEEDLRSIQQEDPTLRLEMYDLPPTRFTKIEADRIKNSYYKKISRKDSELFNNHTNSFLESPHILVPLFSHVMTIRSEDNIDFPIKLKKLADHLRALLLEYGDVMSIKIHSITKSHQNLWAEVLGEEIAFLDGGVANIPEMAGMEPMAQRVGIYSVKPGEESIEKREKWDLSPYVIGDIVEEYTEDTDIKRLQEAARYLLEPLTGLNFLQNNPETSNLFLHGPLINAFLMYDEGEPHYIPNIDPEFLKEFGIQKDDVIAKIHDIPNAEKNWNQFMAIYAFVMQELYNSNIKIAGLVERASGRSLTKKLLYQLEENNILTSSVINKIEKVLDKYKIKDDFLFGCILREGEYLSPVKIQKNPTNRARERWQPVVKQYPTPFATMLKSEETQFPFRVELNSAAYDDYKLISKIIYHTSRLLPRYAFPVGLDIVDKYAKIPDWIAKGVTSEISASVLRRALKTGDPNTVSQVKRLLAKGPRDFFYRPNNI